MEACDLLSLGLDVRGWIPLPSVLQVGMLLAPGYLPRETTACASVQKGGEARRDEERYASGLREPTRALLHFLLSPNSISLSKSEMLCEASGFSPFFLLIVIFSPPV